MTALDRETPIGHIAAEYPLMTRVFARHGIDYCCGGGRPLREACEAHDLDTETVLRELEQELEGTAVPEEGWLDSSLDDLIEYILVAFHRPLKEELPRLEQMARKVNEVHGARMPQVLPGLLDVLVGLRAELEAHMAKEEQILFPMIRRGHGAMAAGPISVMEHEHDSAGNALRRLRKLTGEFSVPADACNTWRALWHGLSALEQALHEHIHLENNILFPRALAG